MHSRQRPKGGQETIHGAVAAIAFVERPLAGGVVDEGHPVIGQDSGQRNHRQDLGEDLEHVDVRPASVELADEPVGDGAVVVLDGVAHADDVAPAIGRSVGAGHGGIGRDPSCLMHELTLQEEGVRIDNAANRPGGGERGSTCFNKARVARRAAWSPGVRSVLSPELALAGIDGADGLVDKIEFPRQSVGGL